MSEVEYNDSSDPAQAAALDVAVVDDLIAALCGLDGAARHRARQALVHIGRPAVDQLRAVLYHSDSNTRWHAVKALCQIADPLAAPSLVEALEDENPGVRWLAAVGLIALGCESLEPLLEALMRRVDSAWLREGAYHVLRAWDGQDGADWVKPLLGVLRGPLPTIEVPWVAMAVLNVYAASEACAGQSGQN
jgi:HEAT repeat protein